MRALASFLAALLLACGGTTATPPVASSTTPAGPRPHPTRTPITASVVTPPAEPTRTMTRAEFDAQWNAGHGTPAIPTGPSGGSSAITVSGPSFGVQRGAGVAGGPSEGSTMSAGCFGLFPAAPQHTLSVTSAARDIYVLAQSAGGADLTIAVRLPDGTYLCNDDSGDPMNGLNPMVVIDGSRTGSYQVFVGDLYSGGGAPLPYSLTVSPTPPF